MTRTLLRRRAPSLWTLHRRPCPGRLRRSRSLLHPAPPAPAAGVAPVRRVATTIGFRFCLLHSPPRGIHQCHPLPDSRSTPSLLPPGGQRATRTEASPPKAVRRISPELRQQPP